MKTTERWTIRLLLGIGVALVVAGYSALTPGTTYAAHVQTIDVNEAFPVSPQVDGETPANGGADSTVEVQTWTIMAAGGAAALFLLLFFARIALGRVAPPPAQEEGAHH